MHTQTQKQSNVITSAPAEAFEPHQRQPYCTVAQFSVQNPAFTEPALRNLIFKADSRESTLGIIPGNSLIESGAIVRLGRKVLIHEERFFAWVEFQGARK